jgi:hypothetical protein
MGVIEHFRTVVGREAAQLTASADRIGKPFIRKTLLDAVEMLNAHLRALEGAGGVKSTPARRVEPRRPSAAHGLGAPAALSVAPACDISALDPIGRIVEVVAQEMGLDAQHIRNAGRRDLRSVFARQICMYLARNVYDLSYPEVARLFGKLDHSTAAHAETRVQAELDAGRIDPERWERITRRLAGFKPTGREMQELAASAIRSRRSRDQTA